MPRGVLSQGSRLVIDNARPTHAGTYTCRVNTNLTSQVILLVTGLVPYFGQVSLEFSKSHRKARVTFYYGLAQLKTER